MDYSSLRRLYAIHDFDPVLMELGAFPVTEERARELNRLGFGIFKTANAYSAPARRSHLVQKLIFFPIDLDLPKTLTPKERKKAKEKLLNLLFTGPFTPAYIYETANGLHVYFRIKDDIFFKWGKKQGLKEYSETLGRKIIPYYKADSSCSDSSRLLREEGFYHCKDPKHPFLIECIYSSENSYSLKEFKEAFPDRIDYSEYFLEDDEETVSPREQVFDANNIWHRARLIPSREALLKLSGTEHVWREKITFVEKPCGTTTVVRNGRRTARYLAKNDQGHEYMTSVRALAGEGGFNWISWVYGFAKGKGDWLKAVKFVLGEK